MAKFVDWANYNSWTKVFIITPVNPSKQPKDLQPGDKIKVDSKGFKFTAEIVENSPSSFQWAGGLPVPGLMSGVHQFHFQPSQETPGGTTLVHKEDFSGMLSFVTKENWKLGAQAKADMEEFNHDIKGATE
jgi:hypothetical protein